jgi:signal transduction histidine kinase
VKEHPPLAPTIGWDRTQRWLVVLLVLGALSIMSALGWSYRTMTRLQGELEQSNGGGQFVDVARKMGHLGHTIADAQHLDDPEVEQAVAFLERAFQVAQRGATGPDVRPEVVSDLAVIRAAYAPFTLLQATRPEAVGEAAKIIRLAAVAAESAAERTEIAQRALILLQTTLLSRLNQRVRFGISGVIVCSALLVALLRKFRSAYTDAYELTLDRAIELERNNDELRLANETKQRFVSMVSHELRTPLTVIRGFGETLMRHGHGLPQEQRDQLATAIVRQARRQQRMVEDLLTVAYFSDAAPEPERTAFDILDVVKALVPDLADELRVKVTIPVDGVLVWADPHHVEQIVENLLTNAHKYGGEHIWVTWHRGQDRQVILCVSDDGAGVPSEFSATMFAEFSQADDGDTRVSNGVGLGLSIARTLALANDGVVRYRDRDGGGAQFEVVLPAWTAATVDQPSASASE